MNKADYYPITRALAYITIEVRDLSATLEEAQAINGLYLIQRDAETAYLSSVGQTPELILKAGSAFGVGRIGLEATNETSFDLLKRRLKDDDIRFTESSDPYPEVGKAIQFAGPSGHVFELAASDSRLERLFYGTSGVRPRRLGHALLKVEDIESGEIVWLRCSDIHHSINLMKGAPGLHHYAWEAEDWSVFKQLGDVLRGYGRQLVWGPGRHGPGNNLFTYHADLTGALVEYFADILRVESEESYQWKDWSDIPEWNNIWGPMPPVNFRDYGMPLAG
jgi:catechol 2,3-dioxygenase